MEYSDTSQRSVLIVSSGGMGAALMRRLVSEQPDMYIVGDAHSAGATLEVATRQHPDLILVAEDFTELPIVTLVQRLRECTHESYMAVFGVRSF